MPPGGKWDMVRTGWIGVLQKLTNAPNRIQNLIHWKHTHIPTVFAHSPRCPRYTLPGASIPGAKSARQNPGARRCGRRNLARLARPGLRLRRHRRPKPEGRNGHPIAWPAARPLRPRTDPRRVCPQASQPAKAMAGADFSAGVCTTFARYSARYYVCT